MVPTVEKKKHVNTMTVARMRMLKWMDTKIRKDRITNRDIKEKLSVTPIA